MSYKYSTAQMRLGLLHINAMRNVPVKYEYIEEASLIEHIVYKN